VVVLARHARRHDVRVVAAGHGHERVGILDPGVLEDVAVEPEADDLASLEPRRQSVEGRRALVDDRAVVPGAGQLHRELRPDAPAADDDDPHAALG
jgi:hypothetical protein